MSDWIYGIVAVMLFGTVILQVTPEGTYQKYVRLFLGVLLMMTVIEPFGLLFGWREETRLSFEQRILSSWAEVTSFEQTGKNERWQEPDHWDVMMKEQLDQKQERWVRQMLESTAQEYGYMYLDHQVQWNEKGDWPERLTMWVEMGADRSDQEVRNTEIFFVDPIVSVNGRDHDVKSDLEEDVYYEPSELRPLHQALQVIWQLEEEQIVLYRQR